MRYMYLIFINNLKDDGSVILDCLTIQMQVPMGNSLLGEGIFYFFWIHRKSAFDEMHGKTLLTWLNVTYTAAKALLIDYSKK